MAVSRRPKPVSAGLACSLYCRSVCDDSVLEMIATWWQYAIQIHFHYHYYHWIFLRFIDITCIGRIY